MIIRCDVRKWRIVHLKKVLLILLIGISLSLSACRSSDEELQGYIDAVKQRPPGPIEPMPTFKTMRSSVYEEDNYRSPFQSKRVASPETAASTRRPKELLESYPLDSLEMVGVLTGEDKQWGLVATPDGRVHRLSVGSYVGKYAGRVVSVSKTEITVIEIFKNQWGEEIKRQIVLKLKR